jgi:hypothetical protein
MSERRSFTEEEAADVLRCAAKLQDSSGKSSPGGLDLLELKRIAAEAGIAEEFVELAMQQPNTKSDRIMFGFGQEFVYQLPRVLSEDEIKAIITEIASRLKVNMSQEIGFTRRLNVSKGMLHGNIEITRHGDRTELKFRHVPFVPYFAGLHMPLNLSFVMFASMAASGKWQLAALLGPGLLLIGFGLFWWLSSLGIRQAEGVWTSLVGRIQAMTQKPTPEVQIQNSFDIQEDEAPAKFQA